MKKTLPGALRTLALRVWMVVAAMLALTACEDNVGQVDNSEFTTNWTERNAAYFDSVLTVAKTAVADAQAQHGDAWEDHCEWRVYRSYAKAEGGTAHDSICARVIDRGSGSGFPMYTDSVKVNYMGRLIPTRSYPEGRVFDHSGLYETEDYVFSPDFSQPTKLLVSNTIEGYTTALMRMRIGDRWMVYIPQELAYQNVTSEIMPAYSTLCFDLQLKGFYRKGEAVN